jgi:hypothetical protein
VFEGFGNELVGIGASFRVHTSKTEPSPGL